MGIIKFLKWLADDDPIKEQKSMVDAAKFEVERRAFRFLLRLPP